MIKVLGENYFVDLDEIEKYLDIPSDLTTDISGETRINIIKFEMVKMMLETVLTEQVELDDTLGLKGTSGTSIPFKIAFNSLLNKKLINHY